MWGGWGLGGKNLAKREDTFERRIGESGEASEHCVRIQVSLNLKKIRIGLGTDLQEEWMFALP